MRQIFIIIAITLNTSIAFTQNLTELISKGVSIHSEASYNYNFWMPDESYNLNYYTEGLQNFKIDTRVNFSFPILPELRFTWETNFNSQIQDELLKAHSQSTALERSYNKLMFVAGFGKRFSSLTGKSFDPRISNSSFDLSYSKETFLISVEPSYGNLYFAPYTSSSLQLFQEGQELSMFTKFEEIKGTFATDGTAILPALFSALFGGDTNVMEFDGADTRLGGYYAQFYKPYSVTQILSVGSTSGNRDYIYNAFFRSYGLVEEYSFMGEYASFTMQLNLGIAEIDLQKGFALEDTESPLFFYYKHSTALNFHIPIMEKGIYLNLGGAFDWSFMWGGNYNAETELIETKSFINSDMIFKVFGSLTVNL